jgi:hypothetical protein
MAAGVASVTTPLGGGVCLGAGLLQTRELPQHTFPEAVAYKHEVDSDEPLQVVLLNEAVRPVTMLATPFWCSHVTPRQKRRAPVVAPVANPLLTTDG